MFKLILLYFLLFLYIFNVSFIFLPEALSTRSVLGFLGVFSFIVSKQKFTLSSVNVILLLFGTLVLSIITTVVNQHFDPRFVGYFFQNVLWFFAAHFVIRAFKLNFDLTIKVIVITVIIHNMISTLMFLNPNLMSIVTSIQHLSTNEVIEKVSEFKSRFIGIGWGNFFFGGVIGSCAMLLNAYLFIKKRAWYWVLSFLFLAITSIYIARISYLGVSFSFIYMIWWAYRKNYELFVKVFILFVLLTIFVAWYLSTNYVELSRIPSFRHSFEIFINLYESGNLSSESTDGVKRMLRFPTDIKGILIGDAKFNMDNGLYYQETDVGFSRLVFYFGLLGLFVYFLPSKYILSRLYLSDEDIQIRYLLVAIGLLLVTANLKGLVDLNWLLFLFFWTKTLYKNEDLIRN